MSTGPEIHAWCEACWTKYALPRINEFAAGAGTLGIIQAVISSQEFKEFSRFTVDHQSALVRFLTPRNPACCFLGPEKLIAIIEAHPLRGTPA